MTNILIKGKTQIDEVINPYRLQDILPGFRENMDAIKELRENYVQVNAGLDQTLSLPHGVWLALNLCFTSQKELVDHIYPRVWQMYPEYRVSSKRWK